MDCRFTGTYCRRPQPRRRAALLDDLVRPHLQRLRNRQTKRLGSLEVDEELELGGLLDRKIARLRALENLVHISGGVPKQVGKIRSVGHETSCIDDLPLWVHHRQPVPRRQVHDLESHQLGCKGWKSLDLPLGVSILDREVASLDVAEITQPLAEGIVQMEIRGLVERKKT